MNFAFTICRQLTDEFRLFVSESQNIQMYIETLLVLVLTKMLCLSHQHGMRGPHHPRGQVMTHYHYRPHRHQHEASLDQSPKLTQDAELLHDVE